jgi:hypothetical protein
MNALVFDTLKLSKRLEDAGFTTAQAQGAAAALADTFAADLATKRDIQDLDLRMDGRLKTLEAELRAEIKAVRTDLRDLEHRMTIRLGGMLAAAIVLVGAMVKLL